MESFTLEYDMSQSLWVLRNDASGHVVRAFLSRREATEGGLVHALVGPAATLRIRNADGSYERELGRHLGLDTPTVMATDTSHAANASILATPTAA